MCTKFKSMSTDICIFFKYKFVDIHIFLYYKKKKRNRRRRIACGGFALKGFNSRDFRFSQAYFNLFQRTATELAHTRDARSVTPKVLHLGINLGWITSDYLPKVVKICRQKNPRFQFSLECLPFHELTAGLREKRLDAVIALENYLMHSLEFETERFTSLQRTILYSKSLPNYEQIKNPTCASGTCYYSASAKKRAQRLRSY